MLDEACEVPGDLGIGGAIAGDRRRDGLSLAEFVDLDDPGHDVAARGLPDQAAGKDRGQKQVAEREEPPVARLDTG